MFINIVLIIAPGCGFFPAKHVSFNIYGMKLNEEHFSSGTVVIHFLDKPYQEINFKSHLNTDMVFFSRTAEFRRFFR